MEDILNMLLAQAAGEDTAGGQQADQQTQTTEPGTTEGDPVGAEGQQKNLLSSMWFPLILMMVVMYFFIFRSPRKRQQQQQEKMQASLQRNARVRTIGGILGTVVEVKNDEVVLKIDEANNTKMRITVGAVAKVLSEGETGKN